ncbi:thioredoxin [Apibacter sp. B2912]|uniref:thioredoxin n=1 Tax=Apibacter sp. B2912 TaxID=2656763 RepID=UPI00137110F5|nr:thioredoxin [Apibacter sp. B2912]MXO33119.1 thioredoxin [Apibacter sp. B2912]
MSNFTEIIQGDKTVLIDFSAEWCQPCKMLAPILKEVKEKIGDKATIIKIDIDKNQKLASAYHIQSVPTLIIIRRGEIKWRESGVRTAQEIIDLINQYY